MPLALRQSTPDEAHSAEQWVTLAAAAIKLDCALRTLQMRCLKQWQARGLAEFRPVVGAKPCWYVHVSVDPRLSPCPDALTREEDVEQVLLERYPRHFVERAHVKAFWLREWLTRCTRDGKTVRLGPRRTDRQIAAEVVAEAKAAEGDSCKIAVRTLQLWKKAYHQPGDDGGVRGLEALIDSYPWGGEAESRRSAAAINWFYDLYRTQLRPSLWDCHAMTARQARTEGWLWPDSVSATRAWLAKYDDIPFTYLCRRGKTAYSKKFMPYSEQDWELVEPGQFMVADHTQCDFWVVYNGKIIRPWFTAVQDCRSRRIVGWRIGPAPHQEAVLLALRMAFHEAVPEVLRIDNGKDFTSRTIVGLSKKQIQALKNDGVNWREDLLDADDGRWKGIAGELDIRLIFARKYSAWSKATLERFFGTFEGQCGKTFATYTGNSPVNRPEDLPDILRGAVLAEDGRFTLRDGSSVPTIDEARDRVRDWLDIHHRTAHDGVGIEGRTPMAVWQCADSRRSAEDPALDFLMSVRGVYKVGPNGVSLTVGNKHLSYGARSAALRPWVGRNVLVAVDPEWPTRCVVYEPDNRARIAALEPNERINPLLDIDGLREVSSEINRERKTMHRARAAAVKGSLRFAQRADQHLRERAVALRATGTDDAAPQTNVRPVCTGFEAAANPVQTWHAPSVVAFDPGDVDDILSEPQAPACGPDWDCDSLLNDPSPAESDDSELSGLL